jgi:hypothetical protein
MLRFDKEEKNHECNDCGNSIDAINDIKLPLERDLCNERTDCRKQHTKHGSCRKQSAIEGGHFLLSPNSFQTFIKHSFSVPEKQENATDIRKNTPANIQNPLATNRKRIDANAMNIPINMVRLRPIRSASHPDGISVASDVITQTMLRVKTS